ncbi:MAG: hypothetical protein AB7S26_31670 [Sandaracinaceae bacterium]
MADIDFGTTKPGETVNRAYTASGDISSVTPTISGEGFTIVSVAGNVIQLRFTAGMVAAGTKSGALAIGATQVTLEATVVHELSVQGAIDCGSSVVGTPRTVTVMVTNRSDAAATLSISPGAFTVSPSSVAASTGPQTVTVTFTPTAAGAIAGSLRASAGALSGTSDVTGIGIVDGQDASAGVLGVDSVETSTSGSTTKTTYKVHVPSFNTKLHMGAAVTPFVNLDGYGLNTDGKGLLKATGNIGIHSTEGNVYLQAKGANGNGGELVGVSNTNTVLAAKGSAYLLGDGGVTICTAVDVSPAESNDQLPDPANMTRGSSIAAGIFAALDGLIALASLFRVGYNTWKGWSGSSKTDVGMAVVSGGAAATATVLGGFSVANAAGQSWSVPGVTIYGHAGVLIGTAGYGSFYAPAGMVLGSIFPLMLGMDAEVLGLRTANLTGKHCTIEGFSDAKMNGGEVELAAKTKITASVKPGAGVVTKSELMLDGTSIAAKTANLLKLQIGDTGTTYLVRVDNTGGIQIGVDAGGTLDRSKPFAQINDTLVKVTAGTTGASATLQGNEITLAAGPGKSSVKLENDGVKITDTTQNQSLQVWNNQVYLKSGSSNMQIAPGGAWVKGQSIKLG